MCERVIREQVRIAGAGGLLAGELAYAQDQSEYACLLAGPHPHMGGTMSNNVITHLAMGLPAKGAVTLRFDYSGVGESDGSPTDLIQSMACFWQTGKAPEDPQMIEDVASSLEWLSTKTSLPLVVIGYSFGAHAAVKTLPTDARAVVLISPTLRQHDYSTLAKCAIPKLIIYSDNDFATPLETTEAWFNTLDEPKRRVCINGGEHFFKTQEPSILEACHRFFIDLIHKKAVA